MEKIIQPVRGTKDLYKKDVELFNYIIQASRKISVNYGFEELSTPIFEFSNIFENNLGENSDIVSKEVYRFKDRSDNSLTLRPEFTAGIIRSFISNPNLDRHSLPKKIFSYGPLFRYDRPQKGRQRQFHQINFELIGQSHFLGDVEMISLAYSILNELGITDFVLEINSLGSEVTKLKYQKVLTDYFSRNKHLLSEDGITKIHNNPLRIFDSKNSQDLETLKHAPSINSFYSEEEKKYLKQILKTLDKLNINYTLNTNLVRGLDYYNSIVFEFTTNALGSQNTILGGGRYDNLINKMGYKSSVPALGFAGGIERIMLMIDSNYKPNIKRPISIIFITESEQLAAYELLYKLRKYNLCTEMLYGESIKKQMKKASKINSRLAIIIGNEELNNNFYKIKDFDSGKEEDINCNDIINRLLT